MNTINNSKCYKNCITSLITFIKITSFPYAMSVKDKLKIAGDLATVVVAGAFGLDTIVQNLAVEHQQHIHDI